MVYADEDEIDWSDGSLDGSPQRPIDIPAYPIPPIPSAHPRISQDSLAVLDVLDQDQKPCSFPPKPVSVDRSTAVQGSSRVQRVHTDVHLNRRLPSKEDYVNHTLYQASQKAYEATFLNTFITHALDPDRIAQCSEDPNDSRPTVVEYLNSVIQEVDGITRRMTWNAHCRTVHLLATDGKDGAPFLDIHAFDKKSFSDYGPNNLFPVAEELNASWHRSSLDPPMVQYSTNEYELDYHTSPLEDIDDFTNTVFQKAILSGVFPTGRAVRLSTSRKCKGQSMPGTAIREDRTNLPCGNWLPLAPLDSASGSRVSQPVADTPVSIVHKVDSDDFHRKSGASVPPMNAYNRSSYSPPDHIEELFGRCDVEASNSDHATQSIEHTNKIYPWRMRLINDHKRRLAQKWAKSQQDTDYRAQSFKQAVTVAISMGIRPVAHDYQKKIKAITAREKYQKYVRRPDQTREKSGSVLTEGATSESRRSHARLTDTTAALSEPIPDQLALLELLRMAPLTRPKKKKRRRGAAALEQALATSSTENRTTASKSFREPAIRSNNETPSTGQPSSPSLNKSRTLESDQRLPPNAYFEPVSKDEKFVWRCAFKHAMGHYYNAGDRKSCRGCNTTLSDNLHVTLMDFYMPSRTFYFQPARNIRWKPSKRFGQPRDSGFSCHNAVAKDAYWKAINTGASEEEARKMGIDAVFEYIKPKPPPKAPTPEPMPMPMPEPDLGPHPSGSATMEHGQDVPDGYYWEKQRPDEEHAWRCDVNHALGRYYLAGDKKSCSGCGSSQKGPGKHKEMDFYLPSGVVVRQEAPGLSLYKPRKPYKLSNPPAMKKEPVTHNQMCASAYFELVEMGHEAEEAMRLAVERVDTALDKKQERELKRQKEQDGNKGLSASGKSRTSLGALRKDSANTSEIERRRSRYRRNSRGGCTMALVPKKRSANDLSEGEIDEFAADEETGYTSSEQKPLSSLEDSSADEESSGSESE